MADSSDLEQKSTISLSLESDLLFLRHSIPSPERLFTHIPSRPHSSIRLRTYQLHPTVKPTTTKPCTSLKSLKSLKSSTNVVVKKANWKGVKRHAFPIVCGYLGLTQSMGEFRENGSRENKGNSALWAAKEPSALINYLQEQRKKSRDRKKSEGWCLEARARLHIAKPRMLPPVMGLSYSRLLERSESTLP